MNETTKDMVQEEVIVPVEKPYTFRKLEAPDMFVMFKIISAIGVNEFKILFESKGVTDLFKNLMFEKGEKPKTDEEFIALGAGIMFDLAQTVITNLPKCEREIYQLLAQVANMKIEHVRKLEPASFMRMVIDFLKKEEFKDFIKVVSESFK